MAKIVLDGLEKVKSDFESFSFAGRKALPRFLDLITDSALVLLRANTPKETGELSNSWVVLQRGENFVTIGVNDENEELLQIVIGGTGPHEINAKDGGGLSTPFGVFRRVFHPGTAPNNFLEQVSIEINRLMSEKMGAALASSHRFFAPYSNRANLQRIAGLTGTRFSPNRAFGRATLLRPRTGLISNRVRIGRRRRRGSSILKKVELG